MNNRPESSGNADRRVLRTKKALHAAFAELVLNRRYDEIQVGDITEDADVGRSTFYEHFRGKDDLLVQSLCAMLDVLAEAACRVDDGIHLEGILAHFWENKSHARFLLAGPPSQHVFPLLVRELTQRIEERLPTNASSLPSRLVALRAAEGTFAVLRAWLAGEADCSPAELAAGLRGTALD